MNMYNKLFIFKFNKPNLLNRCFYFIFHLSVKDALAGACFVCNKAAMLHKTSTERLWTSTSLPSCINQEPSFEKYINIQCDHVKESLKTIMTPFNIGNIIKLWWKVSQFLQINAVMTTLGLPFMIFVQRHTGYLYDNQSEHNSFLCELSYWFHPNLKHFFLLSEVVYLYTKFLSNVIKDSVAIASSTHEFPQTICMATLRTHN